MYILINPNQKFRLSLAIYKYMVDMLVLGSLARMVAFAGYYLKVYAFW